MEKSYKFLSLEVLGGLTLAVATLLALIFANTGLSPIYDNFVGMPFSVQLGSAGLEKPLLLWINDGLMAIFFLLIALELKREVLEGELSSISQVVLPLAGAFGGLAVPASIYLFLNRGNPDVTAGWAIPIATDIAFALGVLAMLGKNVPKGLKTFLLTLAVFDDLGAILIIAFVYTGNISWKAKGLAFILFLILVGFNKCKVTRISPYCMIGLIMWLCVLKSGVHATLAGVLLGFTIPLRAKDSHGHSPLHTLEHALHPWVAFLILPIFAFSNAGVSLAGITFDSLSEPVTMGIILGLLVGKTVGVFGFSYILVLLGKAKLPEGATPLSLFGVAVISGIGFTMSLFIGTLAFEDNWDQMGAQVRLGVLVGSFAAAIFGTIIVKLTIRRSATL